MAMHQVMVTTTPTLLMMMKSKLILDSSSSFVLIQGYESMICRSIGNYIIIVFEKLETLVLCLEFKFKIDVILFCYSGVCASVISAKIK